LNLEQAVRVIRAVPPFVATVGLFVDPRPDEVEAVLTQFDQSEVEGLAASVAAVRTAVEPLGLEEAFVHLVGGWQGLEPEAIAEGLRA
jgi:hypothetical protein